MGSPQPLNLLLTQPSSGLGPKTWAKGLRGSGPNLLAWGTKGLVRRKARGLSLTVPTPHFPGLRGTQGHARRDPSALPHGRLCS